MNSVEIRPPHSYSLSAAYGGATWEQLTPAAGWSSRYQHAALIGSDNTMFVLGGYDGTSVWMNDVWRSSDGVTWDQLTQAAGWSARNSHAAFIASDDTMFVLGGFDVNGFKNDVWRSSGGVTWEQLAPSAGWSARFSHAALIGFDNTMFVLGGSDNTGPKNDVWRSSGVTWEQLTPSAEWSARNGHAALIGSDNTMFVLGGYSNGYKNDVWRSSGGVTWEQLTPAAGWSAMLGHAALIGSDNTMFILGGYDGSYKNDVWRSSGGVTWDELTPAAEWSARSYHAALIGSNNTMFVLGGSDNTFILKNDVWRSSAGPTAAPSVAPTDPTSRPTSYPTPPMVWTLNPGEIAGIAIVSTLLLAISVQFVYLHLYSELIHTIFASSDFVTDVIFISQVDHRVEYLQMLQEIVHDDKREEEIDFNNRIFIFSSFFLCFAGFVNFVFIAKSPSTKAYFSDRLGFPATKFLLHRGIELWTTDSFCSLTVRAALWPFSIVYFLFLGAVTPLVPLIEAGPFIIVNATVFALSVTNSELLYHFYGDENTYRTTTLSGIFAEDVPQIIIQLYYAVIVTQRYEQSLLPFQILSFTFIAWRIGFSFTLKVFGPENVKPFTQRDQPRLADSENPLDAGLNKIVIEGQLVNGNI